MQKSSKWVTSFFTLKKNPERQELTSFAMVIKDHMTLDSVVRIM